MSGEDTRRRVSTAIDMPGGLEAPLHAKLREELAQDPESAQWAADVQKLDTLLRGWPEEPRSEAAWEGLAARIEQRLSEALPAGLDFATSPFFDDEDARMSRPDASSGRVKTSDAQRELEAKRAEFSLSKLSHLDALKPAMPPPPPRAGNPKLAVVPAVPAVTASAAPLPKPAARPQGEERFSIPTFATPLAPLGAPSLQAPPAEAKAKRTPWLLYGGSALAAAAVVLIAVLVLPQMSSDQSAPEAAGTAASAPPAMQGAAMDESVALAPTSPSTATPAAAGAEAAEPSAARMIAAPVVAPAPPPISAGATPMGGMPNDGVGRATGSAAAEGGGSAPRAPAAAARPRGTAGAIAGSPALRAGGGGSGGGAARPSGGSAARPGGNKAGPPAGPMPDAPSRADVIAAMASVRRAVATCAVGRGGVAQVRVTFSGPSGRVMNAVMEGQFAGTPQGSCIARAVRAASVPRFSQPSVTVSYPFQI